MLVMFEYHEKSTKSDYCRLRFKIILDEIANMNFLYDIVHTLQNTIDWCINSATDRRGCVRTRPI